MAERAERLMNLHIMLLGARRFVSKQAIRRAHYADHPDTPAGDEAFERAFERDKEALRSIGAAIEVGTFDPLFEDEVGYRIPTEQTSLPEVRFAPDEASILGLATHVWQNATLARATERALTKLKAQGVEVDPRRLDVLGATISADEPAFDVLWEAIGRRREVAFDYRRSGAPEPTRRRLQPWGLLRSSGRWYVAGHDLDREQLRVFRLSRIVGRVRPVGRTGAYEVPEGTDVPALARRLVPDSPRERAEVLVRPGTCAGLRRHAVEAGTRQSPGSAKSGESWEARAPVPALARDWDSLVVEGPRDVLLDEVMTSAANAVVLSPATLRDRVVARLRAALEET